MKLTGVEVADERPLAGRLVGWMFVVGSIVTTLLPLLPGVEGAVITPTTPIGVGAGVWGVVCLRRVDWIAARGRLMHLGPFVGALCAEVAMHDNGGAASPARFLLMLVVVYTAYFFPSREAWPYLGLVLVLHALPLTYDPHAAQQGPAGRAADRRSLLLAPGVPADHRQARHGGAARARRRPGAARPADRPGQPPRAAGGRRPAGAASSCCCSTSTTSSASTPSTAIPAATARWSAWPAACARAVRAEDLPARLGGDEFAVLVGDAVESGMAALAERVMRAVRTDGTARVSAGWAIGAGDADALLLAADRALADAKRAGKDRVLAAA